MSLIRAKRLTVCSSERLQSQDSSVRKRLTCLIFTRLPVLDKNKHGRSQSTWSNSKSTAHVRNITGHRTPQ